MTATAKRPTAPPPTTEPARRLALLSLVFAPALPLGFAVLALLVSLLPTPVASGNNAGVWYGLLHVLGYTAVCLGSAFLANLVGAVFGVAGVVSAETPRWRRWSAGGVFANGVGWVALALWVLPP